LALLYVTPELLATDGWVTKRRQHKHVLSWQGLSRHWQCCVS
jgi:hypothetical protein